MGPSRSERRELAAEPRLSRPAPTVFRLDHCGQTAGQRAFISQRGYVATRLKSPALAMLPTPDTRACPSSITS
jgi:hypothetical protein